MKQNKVFHRDLKLDNLFLDENFNVKVGDFGYATSDSVASTYWGTKFYIAPEITTQRGNLYDASQADCFSFGVILFTLKTIKFPFSKQALKSDKIYKHVANNDFDTFWEIHDGHQYDENFK